MHDLMEQPILQNRYPIAKRFLSELTESLELSETPDVKSEVFESIPGVGVYWIFHMTNQPEIIWEIAGANDWWEGFASRAQ
jgi:hypothetical protein